MQKLILAMAAAFVMALTMSMPAFASGPTTFDQTIQDADSNNRLELGPGEGYVVREDLGDALSGRENRRQRLINLGQLTDIHYVDEESPLRLESLDDVSDLFSGAYRPDETLTGQVANAMTERLRNIQSPIDGATPENFLVTGDSADNKQKNEIRGIIDILDGGVTFSPDSGRHGICSILGGWSEWQWWPPGWVWKSRYAGVRGGGQYYEPDSSAPGEDGPGYSPSEAENFAETGRSVALRDFPGLFESAQKSFQTTGLGAPWYSAMGNHDGLIQGNIPNPLFGLNLEFIATGCLKDLGGGSGSRARDGSDSKATGRLEKALRSYTRSPSDKKALGLSRQFKRVYGSGRPYTSKQRDAAVAQGLTIVPDDPNRHILSEEEWVQEHFNTSGTPVGHGFADRPGPDTAYYSVSPKPGIRYIGLNSINDDGLANGRIDDAQFQWLESEIQTAQAQGELIIVFAHHTLETMDNGLDLPPLEGDYHFGLPEQNGLPPHSHGESLEDLFLRYPNVVAYVSGHEHENRVTPYHESGKPGSFWELSTAAHIDWPSQSRLIELFDNEDGTLSIFGTLVDHAADPDPGDNPNLDDPLTLASIGRELTWNDKQADTGENGTHDARGAPEDRNVELILPMP